MSIVVKEEEEEEEEKGRLYQTKDLIFPVQFNEVHITVDVPSSLEELPLLWAHIVYVQPLRIRT